MDEISTIARTPRPASRSFRLASPATLFFIGIVAAFGAGLALLFAFGPFSDLSAIQLAAGPAASTRLPSGDLAIFAGTGRSWGERTPSAEVAESRLALARAGSADEFSEKGQRSSANSAGSSRRR